jgi:predicted DNA-binding transcriptional regulator AlpA
MPDPNQTRTRKGRFGEPVAWYEHEVENWVHGRVRAGSKMPALPPPQVPNQVNLIRFDEVHKRTGLKRWTVWDLERRGLFPRRVLLHSHALKCRPRMHPSRR